MPKFCCLVETFYFGFLRHNQNLELLSKAKLEKVLQSVFLNTLIARANYGIPVASMLCNTGGSYVG